MSFIDLSIAVDMIELLSPTMTYKGKPSKPVYTLEWGQVVNAIKAFRDLYYANKVTYSIPQSKLSELDSYIDFLPDPKFGDPVKSVDYGTRVEALRVICELLPYLEVCYFKKAWYLSSTLKTYYTSYYSGSWDNFWNGLIYSLFNTTIWRHRTAHPTGYTKACFEHWFNVNRYYAQAKVRIKCYIYSGKAGQPHVEVCFLSAGSPKPLSPINQRLCVLNRGDVTIKDQVSINYQSGVSTYDKTMYATVNATCPYIVVLCHDMWDNQEVFIEINEVYVTPQ